MNCLHCTKPESIASLILTSQGCLPSKLPLTNHLWDVIDLVLLNKLIDIVNQDASLVRTTLMPAPIWRWVHNFWEFQYNQSLEQLNSLCIQIFEYRCNLPAPCPVLRWLALSAEQRTSLPASSSSTWGHALFPSDFHPLSNKVKASSYIVQYPVLRTAQSAFTLYFPDRPVHSDTISASLGSIQSYAAINARRLLVHVSIARYSF